MCVQLSRGSLSEWPRVVTCPPRCCIRFVRLRLGDTCIDIILIDSNLCFSHGGGHAAPIGSFVARDDMKTDKTSKALVQRPVPRYRGTEFLYDYLGTSDVLSETQACPAPPMGGRSTQDHRAHGSVEWEQGAAQSAGERLHGSSRWYSRALRAGVWYTTCAQPDYM